MWLCGGWYLVLSLWLEGRKHDGDEEVGSRDSSTRKGTTVCTHYIHPAYPPPGSRQPDRPARSIRTTFDQRQLGSSIFFWWVHTAASPGLPTCGGPVLYNLIREWRDTVVGARARVKLEAALRAQPPQVSGLRSQVSGPHRSSASPASGLGISRLWGVHSKNCSIDYSLGLSRHGLYNHSTIAAGQRAVRGPSCWTLHMLHGIVGSKNYLLGLSSVARHAACRLEMLQF